ncbi:sensor histidine kinase [Saccharibacillus brassicae]|uniref:histidine kinase n=1 Tax=Saccharibacillus brassicae TaxID=2583377 RepID=A0A4Y6UR91_SACBS|nr:HAMP domain-containing sensor histidine kinase [Saccharibacillus brassicae]QDH20172.1 HAMP domain-containing histidine kinase [Saccharibacillus brassicae]
MTIKRRLFISNILMIAIPIVLAIMLSSLLALLLWREFDFRFESSEDYYGVRDSVMQASLDLLGSPDPEAEKLSFMISRVDRMLTNNDMALRIYETSGQAADLTSDLTSDQVSDPSSDSASNPASARTSDPSSGPAAAQAPAGTPAQLGTGLLAYSLGGEPFADPRLAQALGALGGTGLVGEDGRELYVSETSAGGESYRIELYSTRDDSVEAEVGHPGGGLWVPISILLGMVAVVALTSRFLTRFVFQKIRQPLEILADGVNEIRDGNLNYRIDYTRKDEFRPVCEAFNEMAGRLKESVWAVQKQEMNRKELLAGISHDLRSPLTSIKAYAEGLLDGVAATEEARHRYAAMIRTKAGDIDHMVSRLFLFSKMDLGDYPNYPEDLDPHEELESFFRAVDDEYAHQGLRVKLGAMEQGLMLHVDPVQFRRVLSNVVENSLKYKERPEVTVSVEMYRAGTTLTIAVSDDGPGVTDEALPKLFDVFYRSDASRSSPNRGSGLGLAISEKAITFMHGTIKAEHADGGGLRIVIELPLRPIKEA